MLFEINSNELRVLVGTNGCDQVPGRPCLAARQAPLPWGHAGSGPGSPSDPGLAVTRGTGADRATAEDRLEILIDSGFGRVGDIAAALALGRQGGADRTRPPVWAAAADEACMRHRIDIFA